MARKSYVAYRMSVSLVPVPLNDLEGHFANWNFSNCHASLK